MKNVYNLDLHESIKIFTTSETAAREIIIVTRVPGGWIYKSADSRSIFVPHSED